MGISFQTPTSPRSCSSTGSGRCIRMTAISGNSSHLTCATRSPEPRLVDRVLSHRSGRPVVGILRCSVRAPDDRDQRFQFFATTHSMRSRWRQNSLPIGKARLLRSGFRRRVLRCFRNYGRSVADIASGGGTAVAAANPPIDRSLTAEICAALNQAIPRNRGQFESAGMLPFEGSICNIDCCYPLTRARPRNAHRGWPWRCAASR